MGIRLHRDHGYQPCNLHQATPAAGAQPLAGTQQRALKTHMLAYLLLWSVQQVQRKGARHLRVCTLAQQARLGLPPVGPTYVLILFYATNDTEQCASYVIFCITMMQKSVAVDNAGR